MRRSVMQRYCFYGIAILFPALVYAQTPAVADGGVLNGASFAKDANGRGMPVAVGSLVSIFGANLATSLASADTVPFSTSLGGVSVTFGDVPAPLRNVIPGDPAQLNAQLPFGALGPGQQSGTVSVVVTVNGVSSAPKPVPVVLMAPGVFSIPPGIGNAVLVTSDGKIAAPTSASASIGYPTRPIKPGEGCFFYATGLGPVTPPVKDGHDLLDALRTANSQPIVMVGGMTAHVDFAGLSPQFPGVYQINITIPNNAPIGDAIPLQIQTPDGSVTSTDKVTIAISQ